MFHDRGDTHTGLDCLSVGTFMDAHGDGIGDCQGLLRRLDTRHGLGVTALWLLPFQPSPQGDGGDDGAEYDGGAPRDGTHACEAARQERAPRIDRAQALLPSTSASMLAGSPEGPEYTSPQPGRRKRPCASAR
jgi:hypothetical protein